MSISASGTLLGMGAMFCGGVPKIVARSAAESASPAGVRAQQAARSAAPKTLRRERTSRPAALKQALIARDAVEFDSPGRGGVAKYHLCRPFRVAIVAARSDIGTIDLNQTS